MSKYWSADKKNAKSSLSKVKILTPKKRTKVALLVVASIILLASLLLVIFPALKIKSRATSLRGDITYLKDGLVLQDYLQVRRGVDNLGDNLTSLEKSSRAFSWLSVVPIARNYYLDINSFFKASGYLVSAGQEVLSVLEPYAPALGFKTDAPAVPISGQERISGLISAMPLVAEQVDPIQAKLSAAQQLLERVDPNRYPISLAGYPVRSYISNLKSTLFSISSSDTDLKELLTAIPNVMGNSGRKVYLVLFQNDKEIRPTGGFWTAYALLGVEKGRIVSAQSGDMYFLDIDNRVSYYPPAPDVIRNYLKLDTWYIRDSNLSPDYRESVETMLTFWNRVPGVPGVDGVIAVDTHFVEDLLALLGGISLPGFAEEFTADNVVYQLEEYSNVLMKHSGERKDVLGSLMSQMISKTFSLPSNSYDELINTGLTLMAEKHILLYFADPAAQKIAEQYGLAGRITQFSGDYLHINDANFGGRKANWFIKETINKKVYQKGGSWLCDLEIIYENTGNYDSEWNTGYRDYLRILVPVGSTFISGSGGLEPFSSFQDLGKTVFATFLAVAPKEKTTIKVSYQLPDEIDFSDYKLLLQKQPGTEGFEYNVSFKDQQKHIVLNRDTILEF